MRCGHDRKTRNYGKDDVDNSRQSRKFKWLIWIMKGKEGTCLGNVP